jgi:hypothetical protein
LADLSLSAKKMKFEKIEIEPRKNPAILDTATWKPKSAWDAVCAVDESYWNLVARAVREGHSLQIDQRCIVFAGSCAEYRASVFFLAGLADGQQVFVALGTPYSEPGIDGKDSPLGKPINSRSLKDGTCLAAYRIDSTTVDDYVSLIRQDKGPKALGATPRLGVGSRMTVAAWPGVWRAMEKSNFFANPIQNSVREVNLLDDLLVGRQPRYNYLANFGKVPEGHTGSTFEGLWVAGVLEALKAASSSAFGADADHITVRREANAIDHAKRVIEAAHRYTFFTLDVSDLLNYDATEVSSESAYLEFLSNCITKPKQQSEVLAYHTDKRYFTGREYRLDKATVGRLVGKYWKALDAVEQLSGYINTVRNGIPFDLELSIDETPPGIDAFTCLTTDIELIFLLLELQRRQIPVTHIAPNFGVEKGLDYRGQDGLNALEKRVRTLYDISCEFGIMLDCHSGDDLKSSTRQVFGRATQGNIHFKVSPALQVIFAETMNDINPNRFLFWLEDTLDYARREAAEGSVFAAECLRQYETDADPAPSPHHAVFHYYNFATLGRRDSKGQFIHREKFYNLSAEFYREYQRRVCEYLREVAADVLNCR